MTDRYTSDPNQRAEKIFTGVVTFCAFAAIVIIVNWIIGQTNLAVNGEQNFNELTQNKMKDGLLVTGKIDAAFGPYAKKSTVRKLRKPDESLSSYFFLVPIYSKDDGVIDCFVSYEAFWNLDRDDIEIMAENILEGRRAVPLALEHGQMTNLARDQKTILKHWVTSDDFYGGGSFLDYCAENKLLGTADKDVILSKITDYSIHRTESAGASLTDILYVLVPGGLCLLARYFYRRKKNACKEQFPRQEDFDNSQQL